jgi:hypothetical protein
VSGNFMSAREADERIPPITPASNAMLGWALVRDKFVEMRKKMAW